MFDLSPQTARLRRPGLLLRAALAGQSDYDRNRTLRRLLGGRVPLPAVAASHLGAAEAEAEAQRLSGDAAYSVARHVTLLIALLAEQRLAAACVEA